MIIGILSLLVASPAIQKILVYPQTEFFTELWLLGPRHTAENYPYNVTTGGNYSIFLGVKNNLGHCAWYVVEVKFRNQTQSAPASFNGTPSSLAPIYNVTFFVPNGETWEIPFTLSLSYSFDEVIRTLYQNVSIPTPDGNQTYQQVARNVAWPRANFRYIKLNDFTVSLLGLSSDFDLQSNEFFANLIFELWTYDETRSDFVYHERFVDLKLNMTLT